MFSAGVSVRAAARVCTVDADGYNRRMRTAMIFLQKRIDPGLQSQEVQDHFRRVGAPAIIFADWGGAVPTTLPLLGYSATH